MKVLSLALNSTTISGIVFENKIVTCQFSCPMVEYCPFFFTRLGLDIKEMYVSFLLPEAATLYKENVFQKVSSSSIKKIISFYEKTLFPFEQEQACYISSGIKSKKTLSLKTAACTKNSILKSISDLKILNITPDYLGSWQKSFHEALVFFIDNPFNDLFFYIQENQVLAMHADNNNIYFTTVLRISSLQNLETAVKSIKSQIKLESPGCVVIGHDANFEKVLTSVFDKLVRIDALENVHDVFLQVGLGLGAQKNSFNLLPKAFNTRCNFSGLFSKLTSVNTSIALSICVFLIAVVTCQNYILTRQIAKIENTTQPLVFSSSSIIKKTEKLHSLNHLHRYVSEVPPPKDVIAFFSSHPAFNEIDSSSGKTSSCQEFDYRLIDTTTAKIKLICYFPNLQIQKSFENDLQLKHITFTKSQLNHLSQYEFFIKKGFLF